MTPSLERWIAVSLAIHALGLSLWVAAGPGRGAGPPAPIPVRVLLLDAPSGPRGEKGGPARGQTIEASRPKPRRAVRRKRTAKISAPPKRSGRTTVEIRRRQPTRPVRPTTRSRPQPAVHRPRPEPAREAVPPRPRPEPAPRPEPRPQAPPTPSPASHKAPEPEPPPAPVRPTTLPDAVLPSETPEAAEAPPQEPAVAPKTDPSAPARTGGPAAGLAAVSPAVEGLAPEAPPIPPAPGGAAGGATVAHPLSAGKAPAPPLTTGADGSGGGAEDRDAQPDYAAIAPPSYPRLARRRGWQGVVRLRVRVSPDGRVLDASVEQSSGYRVLDRAALEAVRGWRFRPAVRGGEPVASEVVVPVRFSLNRSG